MWVIIKAFLRSYVFLCLLSFVCFGHPWIQRLLVLGWMVHMVQICDNAQQKGIRVFTVLGLNCVSQLPGIVLILISTWSLASGELGEWPSGLMEVWYHPFIPVLELLPPGHIRNWSDMYLVTCLVPAGIISVCWICWMITSKFRSSTELKS